MIVTHKRCQAYGEHKLHQHVGPDTLLADRIGGCEVKDGADGGGSGVTLCRATPKATLCKGECHALERATLQHLLTAGQSARRISFPAYPLQLRQLHYCP